MKETFDLTVVPSVRYIEYYTAYQMLWTDQRYNFFHTGDFLNFLEEGYTTAPQEVLRPRVLDTRFHLLFEYTCAYLAEYKFEDTMTTFLKARKLVKENLGIEWDMKSSNPNFGKKNTFKKSQMRSVL